MTSLSSIMFVMIWLCCTSSNYQNHINEELTYFLRTSGSFSVQRDGVLESLRPSKLRNADEFDFTGGYRTEQGVFCVNDDIIKPVQVPVLGISANQQSINIARFWPEGTVPFLMTKDVTPITADRVHKAMSYISNVSCVKFEEYNNHLHSRHSAVLTIQGGPICASFIGYHPALNPNHIFEQHLILSDLCPFGSVLHELMHTLGFQHEGDRYDRLQNLQSSEDTSGVLSAKMYDDYDHFSIMHKSMNSISLDPLRQFMIGQRIGLSFMDIKALNFAYKCDKICSVPTACLHHGFTDKSCSCVCPDGFIGKACEHLTGMNENLQEAKPASTSHQYYGSNRKIIQQDTVLVPSSVDDKPILMLYDHQQQSNLEYDSIDHIPSLQAAVFIYNPNVKVSVDLSSPSYLSNVYKYKDEVHSKEHVNSDWIFNGLNKSSNVYGQLGEGQTLWLDANSFQLDHYHPIYYASPNVTELTDTPILYCNFDKNPFEDPNCPMNISSVWTYVYNDSINNGYMHIDNSMFTSSKNTNSGLFQLGPISAFLNESTCLSFDYKLSGKGVGGLSTYYISKGNDRRQGSVFGWTDMQETWNHKVQNLSDIFYDKNALEDVVIEFLILPGWDKISSISVDNIEINKCSKLNETHQS